MTSSGTPDTGADNTNLRRDIGLIALLFTSVGSIIGSGWLFGAMSAAQTAGPAAVISWAVGMVMILFIALTFAELGTMFPVSGGVVRFPHIAYGSFASYVSGWILWVACGTVAPIEVEGALQYATKYAPFTTEHIVDGESVHTLTTLGYISAVVMMALFVFINYIGVSWFAKVNTVLVWWKLAMIVLVIVVFLMTQFHTDNFSSQSFMPYGWKGVFTAIATSGIVFSYLGFRQGIELAGETSNPRKYVPIAVIGSVVLCGLLYIGLQVAFIGSLNPSTIVKGWSSVSFENDFGPLAAIATLLGLGWLAFLLYVDAIISPADTGLIYTTVTSRVSYAMGQNGNAPRFLSRTTKRGVPFMSLVLAFLLGLVCFLPFPSWQQLVGFITSATVLSFAAGPLVMGALRRSHPELERPFRCPGGDILPLLSFISSNLIVVWSGWDVDWKLFVMIGLGLVLLVIHEIVGHDTPPLEFRSGSWMVLWLAGLAVLVYLSDGMSDPVLSFEMSALITAVFSLVVYYVTVALRLSPETTDQHIADVNAEAELEAQQLGAGH